MPLTPQDVRNKLFTSVRFKHGYDEDEVDAFLDQVENDLKQLYGRIDKLTGDLEVARATANAAPPGTENLAAVLEPETASFAPIGEVPASLVAEPLAAESEDESQVVTSEATAASGERRGQHAAPPVEGTDSDEIAESAEASGEVAVASSASMAPSDGSPTEEMLRRTLILAQRTADALLSEARTEAETLVSDARTKAEQIERESVQEHSTRQQQLQAEHDHLNGLVEQLRGFENEYRSRLRAYLHLQLRDLETTTPADSQPQLGNPRAALDATSVPEHDFASGEPDSGDGSNEAPDTDDFAH